MHKSSSFSQSRWLRVWLFCALVTFLPLSAHDAAAEKYDAGRIQQIVDDLKTSLEIEVEVTVTILRSNELLVSVERLKSRADSFEMAFEEGFLSELDDDELRAVIAHELGHVWIFTHHPYLQTERLANEIAMRAVSRESLEKMYAKVWRRDGTKGSLVKFLGQ